MDQVAWTMQGQVWPTWRQRERALSRICEGGRGAGLVCSQSVVLLAGNEGRTEELNSDQDLHEHGDVQAEGPNGRAHWWGWRGLGPPRQGQWVTCLAWTKAALFSCSAAAQALGFRATSSSCVRDINFANTCTVA